MKKCLFALLLMTAAFAGVCNAEDATEPATPTEPAATDAPAVVTPAAEPPSPAAPAPQDTTLVDNLEFISGEISELDEASKAVSVRLYGENENATSDKVLKVNVDENTDITDGEQDRDLKSLSVGTEVDVEYDPATNKATYIFVY